MNAKDSIIPASYKFLPGHSVPSLRKRHRKEKDPVIALRLLTHIKRKEGHTIRRICRDIGKPYATVRNRLVRTAQRGITGRHDELKPGRRRRLDEDQLVRLRGGPVAGPRSCGFESGMWTAKLLIPHIKKKYGVEYRTGGIYYLLHRIGFSSRKPEAGTPNQPRNPRKNGLKKKLGRARNTIRRKGYAVMAADEASHMISWNIRNGRYPEGRPATAPVSLSRKRFYSYCALKSGVFHCRLDKNNTDSFIDFLAGLRYRFGRVLLFVDNAAYHKSARLKERLAEWDGDVLIRYLPPYTPEPNPAGVQWDIIKKAAANVLYAGTDAMKSVRRMLRTKEIGVAEMSHYLPG